MSSTAGPSQIAGSASAPQFRTFTSFDIEEVRDVEDETQSPAFIRSLRPPVVVTPTSAHSPLEPSLILSSSTHITILDRHFTPTRTFRAWEENGKCTALIEAGGLLVGIGEDEGSRYPVLKIWDLTRDEKRRANSGPVLMRNVRIQHGQRPHPVSAIALTSNLSHLAIGLGDGTVLLYRHLLQSLSTSPTALTSLPKARVIHESPEPVTGLGFREATPTSRASAPDSDKANAGQLSLFVVTTNRVLCASASGRGGDARTIDERGAGLGCACMSWDRSELIVARDEGIDLYGPGGRGRCYAYEGPKSSVAVYRHNLIITSPSFIPTANSASATVRNHVKKDPTNGSDIAKVTVFDIMNSIITYSGTFREGVRGVFFQWGEIFVLGSDSKLSRLDEHSTSAKLEVLYKRNQYKLAIQLAESQGMGDVGMADIRRKYGDYLYTKGDFDGSTDQFVQTLGHLQPSYVIRKFLDAQRIPNLTEYLQQLHERGLANPDHTTLLLNCYTKTGDRDKLDSFLKAEVGKSGASSTSVDIDELPFDLDTAIRVCRQAGFYEHASYLAKRWGRHEDYLRIQIEDAEKYEEALEYLRSLGHAACQENLDIYGRALLQHEPTVTTELLIDLCSGQLGRRPTKKQPAKSNSTEEPKANGASGPAMLSYLGVNKVTGLFLGDASSTAAGPTSPTVETNGKDEVSEIQHALKEATLSEDLNHYVPPSPQTYFAHFVDHPDHFVAFLEAVAQNLWSQSSAKISTSASNGHAERRAIEVQQTNEPGAQDQQAVWNTLLELYLSPADPSIGTRSKQYEERALAILRDSGKKYDPVHALILCSTAGFNEGMVDLWESMGMYEDILRFYMDTPTDSSINPNARHPSDEVLRYLDVYGPDHHHLYPLALRYLTSSPEIVSRQSSAIPRILQIIDEEHILPPLAVVQLLSRNGVASVGLVKEWLRAKVSETRQDVESDKHLVESYRNETKEKEGQLKTLADPTAPETFQVTRCASCSGQLDLPSVHFMCKHSYHQRCLSDSEPECILCARQHSIIREVRRGQTRLADRHDLFVNEVHEAEDGFAVVAGAFGRGLMGRQITSAPS